MDGPILTIQYRQEFWDDSWRKEKWLLEMPWLRRHLKILIVIRHLDILNCPYSFKKCLIDVILLQKVVSMFWLDFRRFRLRKISLHLRKIYSFSNVVHSRSFWFDTLRLLKFEGAFQGDIAALVLPLFIARVFLTDWVIFDSQLLTTVPNCKLQKKKQRSHYQNYILTTKFMNLAFEIYAYLKTYIL